MRKSLVKVMLVAALGLLVSVGIATPTRAETGAVVSSSPRVDHRRRGRRKGRVDLPRQALSIHGVRHERGLHGGGLDDQVRWQGTKSPQPRRISRAAMRRPVRVVPS